MSSAPSSSLSNESRNVTYMSDSTNNSMQQPPFVSRSSAISTLPPPQNAINGTSTHSYSHPLSYSNQGSGLLHTQGKNSFQRYGLMVPDTLNYPSLSQQKDQNVQKFHSPSHTSQAPLQNLPQNSFPLSTSTLPATHDKSSPSSFPTSQGQIQSLISQSQQAMPMYASQEMDFKASLPSVSTAFNVASTPVYSKETSYSPTESEATRQLGQSEVPSLPKLANFRHAKNPKDPKMSRMRFNRSLSSEPHGSKPYRCTSLGCRWSFARQSDLRRHTKSHIAPAFHCPYWKNDPTCHRNGGSFSRLDVLKRHLRLVHYIKDKENTYAGSDPGWCRSCQKLFSSSKDFIDHCEDCSSQAAPAEWKMSSSQKDLVNEENE
ncbi:hypothetical protein OXX69_005453 [Metschnikowia pulcherrima]